MILDITFRDGGVRMASPGGSIMNTALGIARLGGSVCFASSIGND